MFFVYLLCIKTHHLNTPTVNKTFDPEQVVYLDSLSLAMSRDMWLESDAVLRISTALQENTSRCHR